MSRGDHHVEEEPERIDHEMALAALDLFPSLVPADPPCSVVLTDRLSIIPALG